MPEEILTMLLQGSAFAVALKIAAVVAGFGLGVWLMSGGGRTVDDRDRVLVEAARRREARR